jgi:hypothetical protein
MAGKSSGWCGDTTHPCMKEVILPDGPASYGPHSENDRAMPNTATHSTRDPLQEEIERLAGRFDASIPQAFTQAMQSFLTAMDYDDAALMRSHLNAALESLQRVVHEAVQKRLQLPDQVREACRKIRDLMKGLVCENCDELGRMLDSRFNEALRILTDLRDGPVRLLQEHGHEVENAPQLARAIEELQELKHGILDDWPWSDRELPPVDWEMVEASRAARQRGEGEPIQDLIRRLGGNPGKRD